MGGQIRAVLFSLEPESLSSLKQVKWANSGDTNTSLCNFGKATPSNLPTLPWAEEEKDIPIPCPSGRGLW